MPIAGTNVGTTYLNVTANTTPYKKSLQGLGSFAGKIGKAIGVAFAVKSLTKFGLSCVELASDLNEVNNVTNKAFAGMGKQVDEWAQKATSAYGLSETMANHSQAHSEQWLALLALAQRKPLKCLRL